MSEGTTTLFLERGEFMRMLKEAVKQILMDSDVYYLIEELAHNKIEGDLSLTGNSLRLAVKRVIEEDYANIPRNHYGKVNDWDVPEGETVFDTNRDRLIIKLNGKMYEILIRPYDPNKEPM